MTWALVVAVVISAYGGAAGWCTYRDGEHGFELRCPPGGMVRRQGDEVRIDLPFASDTTLREKYLWIQFLESPPGAPHAIIWENGCTFLVWTGEEGAAGSVYRFQRYVTKLPSGGWLSLTFVLRSVSPDVFDVPPPRYDLDGEPLAFYEMIATFHLLSGDRGPKMTPRGVALIPGDLW